MSLIEIALGIRRGILHRNPKKSRRNQNYTTSTAIELNCTHCFYSVDTKDASEQSPSINRWLTAFYLYGIPWSVPSHACANSWPLCKISAIFINLMIVTTSFWLVRGFADVQGSGSSSSSSACNIPAIRCTVTELMAHGILYFTACALRIWDQTFILNNYVHVLCVRDDSQCDAKPFHNCVNNIGDSTQLTQRTDTQEVSHYTFCALLV